MFTIASYPYTECPAKKCRKCKHGHIITEAIRMGGGSSDEVLAKYVAKSCRSFASVLDQDGRGALHEAAAMGRYVVVEWLLNHGANVNLRTRDAQTAMHVALENSHINVAVLLQQYGANLEVVDQHYTLPLSHCQNVFDKVESRANEILVWGSNKNYNLGLGNVEGRPLPQHLDFFNKLHTSIEEVAISPYHCLFVDARKEIYAVGHGNENQLGIGKKGTLVMPQPVKVPLRKLDYVKTVSVSRHHSLVLSTKGHVYVCGSNMYCRLDKQAPKPAVFSEVRFDGINLPIQGIIASEYHSIAYTVGDLYVWGTNVGQFGPKSLMPRISDPFKMVTYGHGICLVASCEAAIAAYTTSKIIMLFYNEKVRTIKPPTFEMIIEMVMVGGIVDLDDEPAIGFGPAPEDLKIMVRTETSAVFVWLDTIKQYLRCDISLSSGTKCSKLLLNGNRLTYIAGGLLYSGDLILNDVMEVKFDPMDYHHPKQEFMCSTKEFQVIGERIPMVNAVESVKCDVDGRSFIALQHSSQRYIQVPKVAKETVTFKSLMVEAAEDDGICDIVFHVEDDVYPAHKYLIFSRAPGLRTLCGDKKHVHLEIEHLSSKMFEIILKFVYNNHMLTLNDFDDIEISLSPLNGLDNREVYSKFQELCVQFGLAAYATVSWGSIPTKPPPISLSRESHPELYDVTIYCANKQQLQAHKCILIARMEYFRMMFTSNWVESNSVNMRTVPIEYIEPLIDFLYDNNVEALRQRNYSDNFLYNMLIICDQFFVNNLSVVFDGMLINRLTIRKCAEVYVFACDYNRDVLREVCLSFMVANVARMIEYRLLEGLSIDVVNQVSQRYRETLGVRPNEKYWEMSCERDALIERNVANFQVDLQYRMEKKKLRKKERKTSDTQQERRQMEKEAIDAMKNLTVEIDRSQSNSASGTSESPVAVEALKMAEMLLAKADWMMVMEKKDARRKMVVAGLRANAVLAAETKDISMFVPLYKQSVNGADPNAESIYSIESEDDEFENRSISLASFTPQKAPKLSQKQRKSLFSPLKNEPTPSTSCHVTENAWATNSNPSTSEKTPEPQPSSSSFFDFTPSPNPTFDSPRSRRSPKSNSPTASGSGASGEASASFTSILREEQREKQYFNKLKNKSLALTLMEERAIDELKKFYNVENVFDERITVERTEPPQPTMNFATWHNKK